MNWFTFSWQCHPNAKALNVSFDVGPPKFAVERVEIGRAGTDTTVSGGQNSGWTHPKLMSLRGTPCVLGQQQRDISCRHWRQCRLQVQRIYSMLSSNIHHYFNYFIIISHCLQHFAARELPVSTFIFSSSCVGEL